MYNNSNFKIDFLKYWVKVCKNFIGSYNKHEEVLMDVIVRVYSSKMNEIAKFLNSFFKSFYFHWFHLFFNIVKIKYLVKKK